MKIKFVFPRLTDGILAKYHLFSTGGAHDYQLGKKKEGFQRCSQSSQ